MSEAELAEELAEEHWDWLGELFEYLYKTAFVHGFKHRAELEKEAKDRPEA